MRCGKVEKLLPAFLDGDLPERTLTQVRDHLGQCSRCAALLEVHRSLITEWGKKESVAPPRDLWLKIVADITAESTRPKRSWLPSWPKLSFGLSAPALGAAVSLVLFAAGLTWFQLTHKANRFSEPVAEQVPTAGQAAQSPYDAPQVFQAVATVLHETRRQKVDKLLPVKAKVVNQAVSQLQADPFFSEQLKPLLDDIEVALTELSVADSSQSGQALRDVRELIQEKDLLVRIAVAKSVLNVLLDGEELPPEVLAAYLQPPR